MLNSSLIKLFTQLNNITNTIIVKYPITVGKSEDNSICFLIDLTEFDTEQFSDLCFNNNFDKFLSVFKLFNDYKCELNNDMVTISEGNIKSDFILSDKTLLQGYNIDPNLFNRIENIPTVCTFDLTSENIKNVRNACGVFSDLNEVVFKTDNNEIKLELANVSKFNARSNTYSFKTKADIQKEFTLRIPVESLKVIPLCDYKVNIKYSSNKDTYRILFTAVQFKNMQIMLSTLV